MRSFEISAEMKCWRHTADTVNEAQRRQHDVCIFVRVVFTRRMCTAAALERNRNVEKLITYCILNMLYKTHVNKNKYMYIYKWRCSTRGAEHII